MRVSDIPEIIRSRTPENILSVEDLWDAIALDEANISVPKMHIEEKEL
jgi:hypothetical protein